MSPRVERSVTLALVATAMAMVAFTVRREFAPAPASSVTEPTFLLGWERIEEVGVLIGNSGAPIKVIEFMDFECPYCRRADSVVTSIRKSFGSQVAVIFVHMPGPGHRFAIPAARVAECGELQGRFDQLQSLLFRKQDSLGLKAWNSYAIDSGVSDTIAFGKCVASPIEPKRIAQGRELSRKIGARGTPTFVVNGWLLPRPPSYDELRTSINTLLEGKPLTRKADTIVVLGGS